MESTLLSLGASTSSISCLWRSVDSHSTPVIAQLHRRPTQLSHLQLSRCGEWSRSGSGSLVRGLGFVGLRRKQLLFAASSAAAFASGGGGYGGNDGGAGGGGGGDGGAKGEESEPNAAAPGVTDDPALSSDVIVLGVGGMTCGGCAASVKRILESQGGDEKRERFTVTGKEGREISAGQLLGDRSVGIPQVSLATVNLKTETAIVWPVSEARVAPNWQKDIGEALAKHLTSCGFKSNLKDQGAIDGDVQS